MPTRLQALAAHTLLAWVVLALGLGLAGGLLHPHLAQAALTMGAAAMAWMLAPGSHDDAEPAGDTALWDRIGLALLLATGAAGLAWNLRFASSQVSDFGVYYRCGMAAGQPWAAWVEACQSNYLRPSMLYWSRSLLYTAPIGMLGGGYPAITLTNAVLHAVAGALVFAGVHRWSGPQAGIAALLLLNLNPEWWYTLTIVTTDNLAVPLVTLFLLLMPRLEEPRGAAGTVLGLAAALLAANLLRTIGIFMALALAAHASLRLRRENAPRLALRLAAVFLLYAAGNRLLVAWVPDVAGDPLMLLKSLSAINLQSSQNFFDNYPWFEHLWPAIPPQERAGAALHRLLAEFATGFGMLPGYVAAKAQVLFSGQGYAAFAAMDGSANRDTAQLAPALLPPTGPWLAPWLAGMMTAQLALALAGCLFGRLRTAAAQAALCWLAAFCAVVLGMGEAQPRYSVLLAPALAMLGAEALQAAADMARGPAAWREAAAVLRRPLAGGVVLIGVFLAGLGLSATLRDRLPLPLATARQEPTQFQDGQECNTAEAGLEAAAGRLRIRPSRPGCVSVVVTIPEDWRRVSLLASRNAFPFPFEERTDPGLTVALRLDGQELANADLGLETARWLEAELPAGATRGRLSIVVRFAGPSPVEPATLWLLRGN